MRTLVLVTILGALFPAAPASAEPVLRYVSRLGFTDPRHTRADGYQSSVIVGSTPRTRGSSPG